MILKISVNSLKRAKTLMRIKHLFDVFKPFRALGGFWALGARERGRAQPLARG